MIEISKKIWFLLAAEEKRKFLVVCFFMIVNALIEVFAIATVAPLIAIIVNPESLYTFPLLPNIFEKGGFQDTAQFSMFLGLCVFFVILVSNSMAMVTHYFSLRFAYNRECTFALNLFRTYLFQPYGFFLVRNATELIKNVHNDIMLIVANILIQLLAIAARSMSAIAIILFIFIVNPLVTLVMSIVLGAAYLAVFLLTKKAIVKASHDMTDLTKGKLELITDSIRLVKDVKMMNAERVFLEAFFKDASAYAKKRTFSESVTLSPKYMIEIIAITVLVFVSAHLVSTSDNPAEVLPLLGIYAFAGYRLLPVMQQIYFSLSRLHISSHSLDIVYSEMMKYCDEAKVQTELTAKPLAMHNKLSLEGATFWYQNAQAPAIRNIDIEINRTERIGVIGRSGCGKSTIVDLLVGLNVPDEGALYVDHRRVEKQDLPSWRANIGYVSQHTCLLDDKIDRNIAFGVSDEELDHARLEEVKRQALVEELWLGDRDERVGIDGMRLSGGQRQRIGIARALYRKAEVLVFDEATSALDAETEKKIIENVTRARNETMIFITHRVETLNFCDRIYLVEGGEIIAQGCYSDVISQAKSLLRET